MILETGAGNSSLRMQDSRSPHLYAPSFDPANPDPHLTHIHEGERNIGDFTRIGGGELLIPCSGSILNGIQGRLEAGYLIFYYPCVEPCIYKFRKTSDLRE